MAQAAAVLDVSAALQWLVLVLGVASVGFAGYFWMFFNRSTRRRQLAKAMQAFLVEQLVSSVGTLAFSAASIWQMLSGTDISGWNTINPTVAQAIRIAMFAAMLHSTVRLSLVVGRCVRHEEGTH